MSPVDYVARVVVASAFHPPREPLGVSQVTSHPRLTFQEYLGYLESYGYEVPEVEYAVWRQAFENYVEARSLKAEKEEHALSVSVPSSLS